MSKKYTPAVFQPTIRPSWKGIISYISDEEKGKIFDAIVSYPEKTDIDSKFWKDTVKPDLDEQYINFVKICEMRGRGARTYWGELKLSSSSTNDKLKDNLLKDKDKDKNKDKDKVQVNNKDKNNYNNDIDYDYIINGKRIGNDEDIPF